MGRISSVPKCVCLHVLTDGVKRKILVLDLDETLIHSHHDGVLRSTVRPSTPPDFIFKVRNALHKIHIPVNRKDTTETTVQRSKDKFL